MERISNAIKRVGINELMAPLIFVSLLIPSLLFRLLNRIKGRTLWLVSEDGQARDNGYHFYRYIRLNHPNDYCFYAIKKNSAKYKDVSRLGNVIHWGSIKHWLYYMSAGLNISSQKGSNPCPVFWYLIHVSLGLYRNRVFLQHGVTHNDAKWLYYSKTKFKYFICGTKQEYSYIYNNFGYHKNALILAGFARWDNLKDTSRRQKHYSILIMPTWRKWLGGDRNALFEVKDFEKTDFFIKWEQLLSDEEFASFLREKQITVYFYPHVNMQRFLKSFKAAKSNNIKVVSLDEDIQQFFNKCNVMITDYSSVAFDFAYLNKPVIYYQFDKKQFFSKQYSRGYFMHERDGFGPVVENKEALINSIKDIYEGGLLNKYKNNVDTTFLSRRDCNSREIYEAIKIREGNNA